jgi:hypothetical protein
MIVAIRIVMTAARILPMVNLSLPRHQVLLLWDRILGFDTLELLPVLAAAIFAFRRNALLQVSFNPDSVWCIVLMHLDI